MAEQNINLATAANPAIFVANKVSQVLCHPCALEDSLAAQLRTIQALQAYWVAKATQYNDDQAASLYGWPTPIVGWRQEAHYGIDFLSHTTATGRLTVFAADTGVQLHFEAGGDVTVADVYLLLDDAGALSVSAESNPSLIEGREDRLALLRQLDELLGGVISHGLSTSQEGTATQVALNLLIKWEAEHRREQEEIRAGLREPKDGRPVRGGRLDHREPPATEAQMVAEAEQKCFG